MDRRTFLKMAGAAGLSVVSPMGWVGQARAEYLYDGPFYVMVNVVGGWDPTYLCDPKGVNGINQGYDQGAIGSIASSPITYAPTTEAAMTNRAFFEKYHRELLVLNGVDMATNSHDPGKRYAWTGKLENDHYPSFAALVAAATGPAAPLSYLSYGGYDATGQLVPLSRISNPDRLAPVVNADYLGADLSTPYHNSYANDRIQQAVVARHHRRLDEQHLPRLQRAMSTLFTARLGSGELSRINAYLPSTLPSDNPLKAQAHVALAAYKAGLCVSVNLALGGFDTHGNHDATHLPRLAMVLEGIDYVMETAEALGIRDKIVLTAASDFARTPHYNRDNGKDHWSITSMMVMGAGIRGNRVVGASDDGQRARSIDPTTLAIDDNGIRLRPEHVHLALRRHAGIADHPIAREFKLEAEELALF
jgi:hypothetical protein